MVCAPGGVSSTTATGEPEFEKVNRVAGLHREMLACGQGLVYDTFRVSGVTGCLLYTSDAADDM
eukprot:133136-Rhodomonas_salina.1